MQTQYSPEVVARYRARLDMTGDCWLWQGNIAPNGYGQVAYKGMKGTAHRIAWELAHGPIPAGKCVCHHCDVRNCCNPAHLFVGTYSDNSHDMWAKGRGRPAHLAARGEHSGSAKLTEAAVREIRSLYQHGVIGPELSRMFKVSYTTVYAIIRRETWRHVV